MMNSPTNETNNLITSINEIKKYLKKLNILISDHSSFILGKYRFVNKKRFDDIICCIEASWTEELNSIKIYKNILDNTTNKTFINSNFYLVNYDLFINRISLFKKALSKELNNINNNN